ncbi:MAG TPA: NAD-dependent epimerase/dehydratase family protein [Thermoanaerobaculia bacterium]|nr:NAD-dependent epimerase/dehydratase family protein [Thermoanaerobaculia bacterium]
MPPTNLITGGAGFIGCNLAHRLLGRGERVLLFDSLIRPGSGRNLAWIEERHAGDRLEVIRGDVRDFAAVERAAARSDHVFHLAGQVAVTSSVHDPRADFEANALGTFNVLEAARASPRRPIVVYASTNKVYGGLEGLEIAEDETRYRLAALPHGVAERQPLDFHSPYGCSKGCGDQYTRDYARIYGLRSVVLRQSCIYGPRQMGVEDQGWLAWFAIAALRGERITIYGDGKQVRDVLFIDDLLDAYDAVIERIDRVAGGVFNIGGGPASSLSVWREYGPLLEGELGHEIPVAHADWRPGDQRVYLSDIREAKRALGWAPKVGVEEGIRRLVGWVRGNTDLSRTP